MGRMVDASCDCGYRLEWMALGGGFANSAFYDGFPYHCADCTEIVVVNALDANATCNRCGGCSLRSYSDPTLILGHRLGYCVYARDREIEPCILRADSAAAYADAIVRKERESDAHCRRCVDLNAVLQLVRSDEGFSLIDYLSQHGLSEDDADAILTSLCGFISRDGKDQDFDELRLRHIEEYEVEWSKVRSGESGALFDCAYPCPKCAQRRLHFKCSGFWD
jgi:ferredoxin